MLARAAVAAAFSDSIELLTRTGVDPLSRLPSDYEIRSTCQALARDHG